MAGTIKYLWSRFKSTSFPLHAIHSILVQPITKASCLLCLSGTPWEAVQWLSSTMSSCASQQATQKGMGTRMRVNIPHINLHLHVHMVSVCNIKNFDWKCKLDGLYLAWIQSEECFLDCGIHTWGNIFMWGRVTK